MSADELLVTRIERLLGRAREARKILQSEVEDAVGKLQALELAQKVAQMKAYIDDDAGVPFEVEFRVLGRETLTVVCVGNTNVMAQMRALLVEALDAHAKCLAEL